MFNYFFKSKMRPSSTKDNSIICAICLESAQSRGGGVPLTSPGCCGSWFHQHCLLQLPLDPANSVFAFGGNTNQNSRRCPNCRSLFQLQVPFATLISNSQVPSNGPLFEEEEVITVEETETTSTNTERPRPSLVLSASAEFPVISTAENKTLYSRVSVNYPDNLTATVASQSSALDVVCILDNSGSMSGSKISSLIAAMDFVIDSLGPRDRLSIVAFNSIASIVHGLIKMTSSNKAKAKEVLHARLHAGGGTDIFAGMKLGNDILQSRRTKNPVSTMFLLTDGQDRNHTESKMELARSLRASNCSLFVFGFGSDHDSEHMAAIAEAGEGTFCYIDTDETVVDAFGGTIGTLQGGSAMTDIVLSVETSNLVSIGQVQAGRYVSIVGGLNRSIATVQFKNLYQGETREVLLQLSVPTVAAPVDDYKLFSLSAIYNLSDTVQTQQAEGASLSIRRESPDHPDVLSASRDILVDVQMNRIETMTAIEKAIQAADRNDFSTANKLIESAMNKVQTSTSMNAANKITGSLLADLQEASSKVKSREEYDRRGGRSAMTECVTENNYQRSCYTKAGKASKYQTFNSNITQGRAFSSRSAPVTTNSCSSSFFPPNSQTVNQLPPTAVMSSSTTTTTSTISNNIGNLPPRHSSGK